MAKALYDLTDQISDWELLEEIFSSQELIDVLSSPTISLDKKWNICDNLAEKTGMNKLCNNFVKMMCKIGEIDEISDILLAYPWPLRCSQAPRQDRLSSSVGP